MTCGPINDLDQVFADPQVQLRNMQLELDHPTAGKVATVKNPINLSETPPEYNQSAPTLGQHTDQVLSQVLGIDPICIESLRKQKIVS
jgi:crotonobetainyl-CoA:carnitine CoA-transferase CaiB-like acyl-CoA transferase